MWHQIKSTRSFKALTCCAIRRTIGTELEMIIPSVVCLVLEGSAESLNRVTIVAPPQNATVLLGRPTVMECMAQGQPKPLVSWSRQGEAQKRFRPIPSHFIWLEL